MRLCAVIGKPNPAAGEIPKAFVVLKEGATAPAQEIIDFIKDNADKEFELIWRENKAKGISRAVLTDAVSEKINQIKDAVASSGLFENKALVRKVITKGAPASLVEKVGVDRILKRVPEAYLKALFASRIAGQYVYKHGLDANEINFFEFINEI